MPGRLYLFGKEAIDEKITQQYNKDEYFNSPLSEIRKKISQELPLLKRLSDADLLKAIATDLVEYEMMQENPHLYEECASGNIDKKEFLDKDGFLEDFRPGRINKIYRNFLERLPQNIAAYDHKNEAEKQLKNLSPIPTAVREIAHAYL